jgi:thiopeptide-type bacteriocin biosynthesis protein
VRDKVATLPASDLGVDMPGLAEVEGRLWGSWHLYEVTPDAYPHVVSTVLPSIMKKLSPALLVDRFFFVRYADTDGHHIRLRLRFQEGDTEATVQVARILGRVAAENGLTSMPRLFELEIERYGGTDYLPLSLDFFCLSSLAALTWLEHHVNEPRPRQLPALMGRLTSQAVALARSVDELALLLDYFAGWKEEMVEVIQQGDRVFESRPEQLTSFLRLHIETSLEGEVPSESLIVGARALSSATLGLRPEARNEILRSQMHMTANRLGLRNKEEGYVTRILRRAVDALSQKDSRYLRELDMRLAHQRSVARIDAVVDGCWGAQ